MMYLVPDRPPFPIYEVDLAECTVRQVTSKVPLPDAVDSAVPKWTAVAIAAVGDEVWATFADNRSDERVIVATDRYAQRMRSRAVSLPFAIVGTWGKEVIAVRRLNEQELVFYNPIPTSHTRRR